MSAPFRIFCGWDSREPIAFSVLAHSILTRASVPVSITPLALQNLRRIYMRERGPLESTEFSLTRFLVPYLSGYQGFSVFMDCDMLCQADILDLWLPVLADPGRAVYVCQHDYSPKSSIKFLNQPQTAYSRKNWSSLMVFDNAKCQMLTPEYVNEASGLELHRFLWLEPPHVTPQAMDKGLIGSLPLTWNWLVGEYPDDLRAEMLHYTLGGPWFPESCPVSACNELWLTEREQLSESVAWAV